MSQSAVSGSAPRPHSKLAAWLRALGHRRARTFLWFGPPFFLGCVASVFSDVLIWPGIVIAVIAGIVVGGATTMHESALCEACIEATPLDVESAVQKYRRRLRRIHAFDNRRLLRALTAPLPMAALFASIFVPPPGPARDLSILGVVLYLLVRNATYLRAEETHDILEPWCPWCDWGDDGDADEEPSPQPNDLIGGRR
jgi:hypothetical protein